MTPVYTVIYEGKDVTKDFSPILESITFKEYLENKAAELELTFVNAEAYFFSSWYPAVNDRIIAKMGYKEGQVINCGTFFVDDITLTGSRSGDVCSFRAMSAQGSSIYSSWAKQNREGKPLEELVNEIAAKLGYGVKGDIEGTWTGIQDGTGLQFLEKLAKKTGYIMKVEGTDLIFYKLDKVKSSVNVGTVKRADVIDYNTSDKAVGRIKSCTVKCWKKDKKQLIEGVHDSSLPGGGSITIWEEVEDQAAAIERAKNYVEDRQKEKVQFEITIPGDVRYRAGVRLTTSGFGRFDKTWYVAEVQHSISKSNGYTTKVTLQE